MKIKIFFCTITAILLLTLPSCSSVQQASGREAQKDNSAAKKDSLYVFDQPATPAKDTVQNSGMQIKPEIQNTGITYFLVQIGAFTTKERADEFANSSRKQIQDEINVLFKSDVNLYVVQLAQHYSSHNEAEKERDILWKIPEFKDAWIVTEQK